MKAMQNSGAFDTTEELDRVFKTFVREQQASKKGVLEFAQDFKLAKHVHGARNKLQAQNADKNMDWAALKSAVETDSNSPTSRTVAERNAERMRLFPASAGVIL
ncbi:MAG: hypothetical protein IJU23_03620 [Proteobacteria bacterium]|nr:hypothetical protein [Pseudomonadota bacterium]